jgi:hypothetical protein
MSQEKPIMLEYDSPSKLRKFSLNFLLGNLIWMASLALAFVGGYTVVYSKGMSHKLLNTKPRIDSLD